jgi:hypothetical protein
MSKRGEVYEVKGSPRDSNEQVPEYHFQVSSDLRASSSTSL